MEAAGIPCFGHRWSGVGVEASVLGNTRLTVGWASEVHVLEP